MKFHADETLPGRVMQAGGANSKTKANDLALLEMHRRAELKRLAAKGLGLSSAKLRAAYDPASVSKRSSK